MSWCFVEVLMGMFCVYIFSGMLLGMFLWMCWGFMVVFLCGGFVLSYV